MALRRPVCRLVAYFLALAAFASRLEALEPDQVFEKASRSVVTVATFDASGRIVGFGSGVVIAPGEVITNCHVVKVGVKWSVQREGRTTPAYLRFEDETRDLCQLHAPLARSYTRPVRGVVAMDDLRVGQRVYAIGAPEGLELTLAEGIISGLRRFEGGSIELIQTTAAISHGSSGGGLFDQDGRLIGITSFMFKKGQNLNFAVPASWVLELSSRQQDLIEQAKRSQAEDQAAVELKRRQEAATQAIILEKQKRLEAESRAAALADELRRRDEEPKRQGESARPWEPKVAPDTVQNQPTGPDRKNSDTSAYARRAQDRIQRLINYPSTARDLKAEFQLSVMVSGWLVSADLVTSSGDPQFDAAALAAIFAADPLHDAREVVPFDGIRSIKIVLRAGPANPVALAPVPTPSSPVAQTPLPTPPKLRRGDENAAILRFQQELVRNVGTVVSERDYPRLARDRGWQGSTMVRVEIGPDGLLKAVTLTRSSGFSVLDDRAVSKIREIKLPNIPDELRERTFSVDVPFRFSLRKRESSEAGSADLPGKQ